MEKKKGLAFENGVGKINKNIERTAVRDIHGVQPDRFGDWFIVFSIRKKMDLMNVHGMQFSRGIDNSPMLKVSDPYAQHRGCIGREFLAVDVKTLLVFRERHYESRRRLYFRS